MAFFLNVKSDEKHKNRLKELSDFQLDVQKGVTLQPEKPHFLIVMKKKLVALVVGAFVVLQSCQNDDNGANGNQEQKVILNVDAESLSNRMNYNNSGVINFVGDDVSARSPMDGNAVAFPMSLLAEVNPPSYNGVSMTASHVDVKDNYVYVSYNTQGDTYLGGIDVIDVSQPNNPQLIIQAILPNTDISTVLFDNGQLYIAGAMNVDANPGVTSPAFVAKMPLQSGLLTNNYTAVALTGNVATGLAVADSKYYGVSGNNGVLAKINKANNTVETTIAVDDLRALGKINTKIVVLSGTQGVKVYNADNLTLQSSFSTSSDVLDAKRTIDFQGDKLLVSEGYDGLKVYNLNSGSLLQTLSLPTGLPNIDQADVVTNAVSVNGDFVYVANGAAGVYVYKKDGANLGLLGSIQLGGSSNYVKSAGDYIFVATGTGGLKIIKKVTVSTIDCTGFATYSGGPWLNVNSGQTLNYQGSAALQGINVNQNLTFCGSLSVAQGLNVNSNGIFTLKGSLAQGQYNNNGTNFNINGTFRVEGSVVIYGNLILNSGAKLEFLGSGSSITIYGNVIKNSNVTITGNYTDTFNKLN